MLAEQGPLARVLHAMQDGAHLRADIARRTGLPQDVVDASVEHLVRSGVLQSESLSSACPTGGCAGCGAPTGHGCVSAGQRTPGPVLLTLSPTGGSREARR